jgi:hypothetical protein
MNHSRKIGMKIAFYHVRCRREIEDDFLDMGKEILT